MAQRMESVAPPGGVMLSASTARLMKSQQFSASLSRFRSRAPKNQWLSAACWAWAISITPSAALNPIWSVGGGRCPPSKACWTVQSRARRCGRRGRLAWHRQKPSGA